jgi:hypothetical protein
MMFHLSLASTYIFVQIRAILSRNLSSCEREKMRKDSFIMITMVENTEKQRKLMDELSKISNFHHVSSFVNITRHIKRRGRRLLAGFLIKNMRTGSWTTDDQPRRTTKKISLSTRSFPNFLAPKSRPSPRQLNQFKMKLSLQVRKRVSEQKAPTLSQSEIPDYLYGRAVHARLPFISSKQDFFISPISGQDLSISLIALSLCCKVMSSSRRLVPLSGSTLASSHVESYSR